MVFTICSTDGFGKFTPSASDGYRDAIQLASGEQRRGIIISKAGYQDVKVALDKTISGVYWLNLLLGGIPGFIVDSIDGAMFRRVPDTVSVQLQP